MIDENKTKAQLIEELAHLRQRVAALEAAETERKRAGEALQEHRDHLEELVRERTAELIKANEHLRHSEERLTLAIVGTGGALWDEKLDPDVSFDEQSGTVYYSPEERQLLGYEGENALPPHYEAWYDHILPEDRAAVEQRQREHFEGHTEYLDHEYRVRLKDGRIRWVHGRSRIIRDERGRPIRWIGIDWDVTERKRAKEELGQYRERLEELVEERTAELHKINRELEQEIAERARAEEALRKSEERYRLLAETTHDIILLQDMEGRIAYINQAGLDFVGFDQPEMIGRSIADFIPAEYLSGLAERRAQRAAGDEHLYRYETAFFNRDGQRVPIEVNSTPILREGRVSGILVVARNITERKQAEEEIKNFKKALDCSSDAIGMSRPNGKHYYQNKTFDEMFGDIGDYPPTTLYVDENVGREVFRTIGAGKEWTGEVAMYGKDNAVLDIFLRAYSVKKGGEVIALVGVHTDITERKQAEEALRASEQQKNLILNATAEMVAYYDADLRVVWANRASSESVAKSPEDLVGSHCYEIWQKRTAPCPDCPVLRARDSKMSQQSEQQTPDGRYWSLRGYPVLDEGGKLIGLVEFGQDITERKQAEAARERLAIQIREQALQMEQILATVPAGVLLLDAVGRVLQANPVAEQDLVTLAGAGVGDRITHLGNRPLAELLTSPPISGLWHEVKVAKRTFEVLARPVEPTLSLPDGDGPKTEDWVLVINDVTQERESQLHIQQQERLAAVGQLAAGIAHDFNNIMAVIVLYTRMALNTRALPSKTRERLEVVSQQAERATALIQQILDFGRRAVLERQPMELTPFLKEVVKLLARTVPENIKIDLVYGADEYVVNADPTRLQQAVLNLVVNARDAMPEGGALHVGLSTVPVTDEIRCVTCGRVRAGDWVCITVTDTGSGISPDVLPYIFEPFFTTKDVGRGTGLGLAQVYGIVKQHEGHIAVTTKVGEGTTFIIYLPALLAHQRVLPTIETQALIQGQKETILVVEDDVTLRRALVDSMELLNYQALEAANGREALELLEQSFLPLGKTEAGQEIDLVLSDVVMPEMGGIALFHALQEKGWQTPVILLTGHPMDRELEALKDEGLRAWLLKPPAFEQLAQVVADVLCK